jgi:hypothetical protein
MPYPIRFLWLRFRHTKLFLRLSNRSPSERNFPFGSVMADQIKIVRLDKTLVLLHPQARPSA